MIMTIWAAIEAISDDTAREIVTDVYVTYEDKMMKIAMKILRNEYDAQDAVQDAVYHIIANAESFREVRSKRVAALVSIYTRNAACSVYRQNKKFSEHFEPFENMDNLSSMNPEDNDLLLYLQKRDANAIIDRAIELMDDKYRDVLVLKYFDRYGNADIAAVLNIEYTQVGGRLYRARKKLYTILEGMGYDGATH